MKLSRGLIALLFAAFFPFKALALDKKVTLQLQWDHQYQFAGYYAALWKGYYAKQGLDVTIRSAFEPGGKFHKSAKEVSNRRADFGVGAIDILKARDAGSPLVILSSVFQHSPVAFYSRVQTGVQSVSDLLRYRIATRGKTGRAYPELMAMLRAENINTTFINTQPIRNKLGLRDLALGHADIAAGFTISAGWLAKELGLKLTMLRPSTYGVDFYGGSIFTHEDLIKESPGVVDGFIRASLQGWKYALQNSDEIAVRIAGKLRRKIPLKDAVGFNLAQVGPVENLIKQNVITLGHTNPARWSRMHKALKDSGLVKNSFDANAAIYDPNKYAQDRLQKAFTISIGMLLILLVLGFGIWIYTQRKNARLMKEQSELLEATFENMNQGIAVYDADTRLVAFNKKMDEFYGFPPGVFKVGIKHEDIIRYRAESGYYGDADVQEATKQAILRSKNNAERRIEVQSHFGKTFIYHRRPMPNGGYMNTFEDVTEQKQTEENLRQASKMEAVGQLTGGIAHDFNNLLAVSIGNLELADEIAESGGDVRPYLKTIMRASERGASLTNQLLAFSRKQTLKTEAIDAGALIDNMQGLLRSALGETIEIMIANDSNLCQCLVDPVLFENVILNLAINARDAMPGGGTLSLHTSNATLVADDASMEAEVTPGDYVMVMVTDTGKGMPADVAEHAFDPFFTTKEVGEGSGLGLSMVYGFIKQSGGHVVLHSVESEGTTIKIYLPQTEQISLNGLPTPEKMPKGRGETILVVEDDPDVRAMTVNILHSLGYQTMEASDGNTALQVFKKMDPESLLITDVVLSGGMSGPEIVAEAKKLNPNIRVLYTSGYSNLVNIDQKFFDKDVEFLQKPFPKVKLAQKIRMILNKPVQ
ncbi:MAG: ABC transporter substrate-binding protein [Rhodospirillales bacterium]|nr:ABC transporter substrate-binding protein [Rhodospirillales bacterium]